MEYEEYRLKLPMLEFDAPVDTFEITGRGTMFSGYWKLPPPLWEPFDLRGSRVKIGGVVVTVTGVDAFAMMRTHKSPYPHSFAVMVSGEDALKLKEIMK